MNFKRLENETDEELIYRVCSQKEVIGTWEDVKDILNSLLDSDFGESTYRKKYQAFQKLMQANEHKFLNDDNYVKELRLERQELAKEKQKLSDERTELNRQIREQARRESYLEMVKNVLCDNTQPFELDIDKEHIDDLAICSGRDLLCHFTDVHTGIYIDNFKNHFDENELKKRIENYTLKIIQIQKLHQAENCYIVASELISGLIHNNLRLQNNLDLMEQFKTVSLLFATMIQDLSQYFNNVYVYTVEGNHSRVVAKKEDSLQGENMDILLPFYLQAKLQNYQNVHIKENTVCKDIAMFNVRGNNVFASHGDKDSPSSVVQNWTMMFGIKPDIVLLGHRHTNGMTTVYDTKVLESGCISGTDQYAMSIRKCNRPEQTVSIIDETGLVCLYDIQLD